MFVFHRGAQAGQSLIEFEPALILFGHELCANPVNVVHYFSRLVMAQWHSLSSDASNMAPSSPSTGPGD